METDLLVNLVEVQYLQFLASWYVRFCFLSEPNKWKMMVLEFQELRKKISCIGVCSIFISGNMNR